MHSPKPAKVSVLVPAFNEEANVHRAYTAIVDTFRDLPGSGTSSPPTSS